MRDPRAETDDPGRTPSPDDDTRLLDALRGALRGADPAPDGVRAAGRMSFALRELSALPVASPRLRPATASRRPGR